MSRTVRLAHRFVELLPDSLAEGVLYVSIEHSTAAHRCCCGCGEEVFTPLTPTDWALTFDGDTVSLHPSIGNWSFPCRSHYLVKNNKVIWARSMSEREIQSVRSRDKSRKERYFANYDPAAE